MLFVMNQSLTSINMLLNPFCPCGQPVSYTDCCARYVMGKALAPTAAALMRSRYTAYSQGNVDYLMATWHPKAGQTSDRASLRQSLQQTRWLGLTIIKTQKGQAQDKKGVVEFVAQYQMLSDLGQPDSNEVQQLHERSRFIQTQGQWFYVDGDRLPPIDLKAGGR
jgi:SEC-C motif domain protein